MVQMPLFACHYMQQHGSGFATPILDYFLLIELKDYSCLDFLILRWRRSILYQHLSDVFTSGSVHMIVPAMGVSEIIPVFARRTISV